MSAPLGGDRLAIEARVEDGARLTVDSAAATVALPGPDRMSDPPHTTSADGRGGGRAALAAGAAHLGVRQRPAHDHQGRTRRRPHGWCCARSRSSAATARPPALSPAASPSTAPGARCSTRSWPTDRAHPAAGTAAPCSADTGRSANSSSWTRQFEDKLPRSEAAGTDRRSHPAGRPRGTGHRRRPRRTTAAQRPRRCAGRGAGRLTRLRTAQRDTGVRLSVR